MKGVEDSPLDREPYCAMVRMVYLHLAARRKQ